MPYTIAWIVEKRVIHLSLEGDVIREECEAISQEISRLLDGGAKPVHLIISASGLKAFPLNLRRNAALQQYVHHPSMGRLVVTGANALLGFVLSLLAQTEKFAYVRQGSLDEAMAYLRSEDTTL